MPPFISKKTDSSSISNGRIVFGLNENSKLFNNVTRAIRICIWAKRKPMLLKEREEEIKCINVDCIELYGENRCINLPVTWSVAKRHPRHRMTFAFFFAGETIGIEFFGIGIKFGIVLNGVDGHLNIHSLFDNNVRSWNAIVILCFAVQIAYGRPFPKCL